MSVIKIIVILMASAVLCFGLAFAALAIGEYLARQSGDLDGLESMLGFGVFMLLALFGFSFVLAAITFGLLRLRDR